MTNSLRGIETANLSNVDLLGANGGLKYHQLSSNLAEFDSGDRHQAVDMDYRGILCLCLIGYFNLPTLENKHVN
jgi:hypothetical protein